MDRSRAVRQYTQQVEGDVQRGFATERTHYPALKALLEALGPGVVATSEPKRIACGAPDFVVTRGQARVGYVEAKDVGASLDDVLKTDQLKGYRENLSNLIVTNYVEFRWLVDGVERRAERAGSLSPQRDRIAWDRSGLESLSSLLDSFFARRMPAAGTPKELAERMARLARMARDVMVKAFETEPAGGTLHGQLNAFRDTLIPGLTPEQFADMYAQTVAYGLFAARTMWDGAGAFTRQNAAYLLPKTNPFLRSMFNHIAGPDLDDRIAWLVDDLAQLLAEADMAAVLEDFGKRTKKEDPVVHFYETFLKEYDPKMREMRGVYYTPEPVVSYIVRSVDYLLRERFGRPMGLADEKTLILDPAAGTGTFLYTAIKLMNDRLAEQGRLGSWNDYVAQHLLPRLFGFELLMAPYAIAHLKLGLELQELGYEFASDQRLGVYLTNTLEEAVQRSEVLFAQFIADEANAAARIKAEEPIMVVMGNPPYSGHSANKGPWIGSLVRDYYRVDGQPLGERNPKWLQDDYVKFLRFGQWRIERTGQGILAFITNHGYLDNPTFRGMRQSLMNAFTDIYVLDLHGNAKKRERAPDGGPDENVFDIQQGVAIGIFVKEAGKAGPAKIHHADVWGLREGKYACLAEEQVAATEWTELAPTPPFYLFVPQDVNLRADYERGWRVTDIFPGRVLGIQTHRDRLAVAYSIPELRARLVRFCAAERSDADVGAVFGIGSTRDWSLSEARLQLRKQGIKAELIRSYAYRPFDIRSIYYSSLVIEYERAPTMTNLLQGGNVALNTLRQTKAREWRHVFASNRLTDAFITEIKDGSTTFPLYLYPSQQEVASGLYRADERRPNLSPEFVAEMERRLVLAFVSDGRGDLEATFGPEDAFHYIYAVLHSPTYRSRYAEFLKRDFPRVPLTSDRKLFAALAEKGAELVALHLMESPALGQVVATFPVGGTNEVEKLRYAEPERRVWINKAQYFEGVEPEVWGFHIGGYQVCEKWLKDRKGRRLSYDDVAHYQKVVVALRETMRLMREIDEVIPAWPME